MLVLDMSPAAVNRTAMFSITNDTFSILKDSLSGVQYFGRRFASPPDPDVLRSIKDESLGAVLNNPRRFINNRHNHAIASSSSNSTIFLDPLYVLFNGLRSDDIVTVLDISTITNPEWHSAPVCAAYDVAFDLISQVRPLVMSISQNTTDTLYANYGFPRSKVEQLPLYVPQDLVERFGNSRSFTRRNPYILFVGSLEVRKNITGAIRSFALSELWREGYELLVVGGGGYGEKTIRDAADGVPNVRFMGYVSNTELATIYRGAAAFLYTSYLEGFGVPLIEALMYGVPAVASTTGACMEVGGNLLDYHDPDDHVSFAASLIKLVRMDVSTRMTYAASALARVRERFSFEVYRNRLSQILATRT